MNKTKQKDNTVFYISLALSIAIVLWGIVAQENFSNFANSLLNFLTTNFGWSYLISMFIFVVFAIILAFSKYGDIKLGPDDSKPEYSTTSWFGMLFGAGMGIGLVFWGVAEPISHFVNPAPGIESGTLQAANFAMKSSFMHWGFHPWANYSIIGLALAYFQFRKNKPGLISSIFIPLLGEEKVNGPIGKLIDILAVFATVAGVATSLGLGTLQINSGLNFLFNIPETKLVQIGIIAVITILYIWTAVSGIDKGIKLLGDINLVLAFGLLILTIIIGPTLKVINSFTNGLGQYINSFISDSLHVEAFGDNSWLNSWTIFYWAWWIAWAPFVGTFIARISKGRTIREFIGGVILAPAVVSVVWFAAFGSMGINLVDKIGVEGLAAAASNPSTALFQVFSNYPLSTVLSLITVVLLGTFFITSANSATFVLGMLSSGGDLNPTAKKQFIWGVVQALLATSLLLAGGLEALQTASVAAAFPFIFVMLFAIVSLMKALKQEI
ncbi:BCCT family transporter [Tissierella carlieri]|uniref:BCCT family transporter n=1 Tax=Tissierella carlieri TaxID=689904 RepID=A0ABT1S9I7_9FIRM|nr:BCCT family transporter [Tissierella carlieri]MBU5312069.1 BCCT family transporter [Tissierella carlieri]MCQ4922682.1 BCCT family transporter [Tissierella carlieri]